MLEKILFATGTIGVKSPDVWGQNRITIHRAEFEKQLSSRLGDFQEIVQATQARTDIGVLTSATGLGAAVAASKSSGSEAAARAARRRLPAGRRFVPVPGPAPGIPPPVWPDRPLNPLEFNR